MAKMHASHREVLSVNGSSTFMDSEGGSTLHSFDNHSCSVSMYLETVTQSSRMKDLLSVSKLNWQEIGMYFPLCSSGEPHIVFPNSQRIILCHGSNGLTYLNYLVPDTSSPPPMQALHLQAN